MNPSDSARPDDAGADTSEQMPARTTRPDQDVLLDMVWPETGLPVTVRVDQRPKDMIRDDDAIDLELDFVTLSLSPIEFIQLAASLRMSVDALLDHHPGLQRAVISAFDLRRDGR